MTTRPRAPAREIFGWAMFDFANSSYTTVTVSVVFNGIFTSLVVGDAPHYRLGNLLWSVALSASYGLVVLTAPVLGAIIDFRAAKRRFLFGGARILERAEQAYAARTREVVAGLTPARLAALCRSLEAVRTALREEPAPRRPASLAPLAQHRRKP